MRLPPTIFDTVVTTKDTTSNNDNESNVTQRFVNQHGNEHK